MTVQAQKSSAENAPDPVVFLRTALARASQKELQFISPDKHKSYTNMLRDAYNSNAAAQRGQILDNLVQQFPESPFSVARVAYFCAATGNLAKGKDNLYRALALAKQHNIDPNDLERTLQSMIKREP